MTATPTTPTNPAVIPPKGMPAWEIKIVAAAAPVLGFLLAWVDPTGKFNTTEAQAVLVLAGTIIGFLILSAHIVFAAVHEYGWSKQALGAAVTGEEAEFHAVWPQMKASYDTAAPLLSKLPEVTALTGDVAALKSKLAATPVADRAAIEGIVKDLVIPQVLAPATATAVASPAAIAPTPYPVGSPAATVA